jgi:hypothetical protein
VLNLDADLELAAEGRPYTPSRSVVAAMRVWRMHLASTLLGPRDILVDESSPSGSARGFVGRAFCPTPRALSMLERAGATTDAHPPVNVVRRVNGRAFCASLGETLPGAAFVTNEAEAHERLTSPPPAGFRAWRVKRAFGMAGRGQRVVMVEASTRAIRRADRDFVRAWLVHGGVRIEPDVVIEAEYALHGVLTRDGSLVLGTIVKQRCNPHGAWIGSERLAPAAIAVPFARAFEEEARRVARSLHEAGYFGPFGIDAFTYALGDDAASPRLRFNPRSEINARYSMGFAVGLGRDWRERVEPRALHFG